MSGPRVKGVLSHKIDISQVSQKMISQSNLGVSMTPLLKFDNWSRAAIVYTCNSSTWDIQAGRSATP